MKPKLIKTVAEHKAAMARIDALMDADVKPGTTKGDELDLLISLVQIYEDEVSPIPPPDPIDAIKFRMEQSGLQQKDLVPYIGNKSKVSEVLRRKRPLSLKMIRALHQNLNIPADVLLRR
jgi:HTH-type transcriptional regulator/antitoxin HigA